MIVPFMWLPHDFIWQITRRYFVCCVQSSLVVAEARKTEGIPGISDAHIQIIRSRSCLKSTPRHENC